MMERLGSARIFLNQNSLHFSPTCHARKFKLTKYLPSRSNIPFLLKEKILERPGYERIFDKYFRVFPCKTLWRKAQESLILKKIVQIQVVLIFLSF